MEYKRKCHKCGKDIYHTSKYNRNALEKKRTPCRTCSSIEKNKKYGNNKKFIERYATKGKNSGEDNAFFGKKHTEEFKEKMREMDKSYLQTPEFRKKMSSIVPSGKKHPMYGKTTYGIWVEKYGKEEADKKMLERGNKQRKRQRG